ncbi:MAG: transposase [Rhodospirillales bacterium]|nr:transposase [Rhodospirillales bacterium]
MPDKAGPGARRHTAAALCPTRSATSAGGQARHRRPRTGRHGAATRLRTSQASHGKGEYGRGPIHTNTIEGCSSIFKCRTRGLYRHCAKTHLQCYLAEFDVRYDNRAVVGSTIQRGPPGRSVVLLAEGPTCRE